MVGIRAEEPATPFRTVATPPPLLLLPRGVTVRGVAQGRRIIATAPPGVEAAVFLAGVVEAAPSPTTPIVEPAMVTTTTTTVHPVATKMEVGAVTVIPQVQVIIIMIIILILAQALVITVMDQILVITVLGPAPVITVMGQAVAVTTTHQDGEATTGILKVLAVGIKLQAKQESTEAPATPLSARPHPGQPGGAAAGTTPVMGTPLCATATNRPSC